MDNGSDDYQCIRVLSYRAVDAFDGLLTARYNDVVDIMRITQTMEDIEAKAGKIGEPIMLSMGDVDRLYLPDSEAVRKFLPNLPEGGSWLPPVSKENKAILTPEDWKREVLFSGASHTDPKYTLKAMVGQSSTDVEAHMAALQEQGVPVEECGV